MPCKQKVVGLILVKDAEPMGLTSHICRSIKMYCDVRIAYTQFDDFLQYAVLVLFQYLPCKQKVMGLIPVFSIGVM